MIIVLTLILISSRIFNYKDKLQYIFLLFIGMILISLNNVSIFSTSGSFFSGSDASAYYRTALEYDIYSAISSNWLETLRYVFYTLYQKIAAFPFLHSERTASFLIKSSNWSVALLSLSYFTSKVRSSIGYNPKKNPTFNLILTLTYVLFLYLALYNYRDILISAFTITLMSSYLTNHRSYLIIIISTLVLINTRFFYYIFLITPYLFTYRKTYGNTLSYRLSPSTEFRFITVVFIVALLTILNYSFLTPYLNRIFVSISGGTTFPVSNSANLFNFVQSFIAGNPVAYWMGYYEEERGFIITPLTKYLIGYVLFLSYFIFIYLLSSIIIYKVNTKYSSNSWRTTYSQNFQTFNRVSIFSFIFMAVLYTIYYEGLQERIRASLIIPILLSISLQSFYIKNNLFQVMASIFFALLIPTTITLYWYSK